MAGEGRRRLAAWQAGETGYPLVDAAMRQLWAIGWMPNYLRHVVRGPGSACATGDRVQMCNSIIVQRFEIVKK